MKAVISVLILLPAIGAASQGPFDASRLSSAAELARQAPAGAMEVVRPVVKNALCGIKQDVDSVMLCVDGAWFSKVVVERKYRIRITAVENVGIVISNRKKVMLGQSLVSGGPFQGKMSKGESGEK